MVKPPSPETQPVSLVVTDVDNTLYDWVHIWHSSFKALLDGIVSVSGISADVLVPEIRSIHQRRRTSEYSHLIQEIPSLVSMYPGRDLATIFEPAIRASREARHAAMTLYPTVLETIDSLRASGVRIIAYTESLAFYTAFRLRRLDLDGRIDILYSSPDHEFPEGIAPESMRTQPASEYGLRCTEHRETPYGHLKPDPEVLTAILEESLPPGSRAIYVGDSLMKDVAMAKTVGVTDVLAAYGASQHREEYALLRDVSHWTDQDVEREKRILEHPPIDPSFRLERSFSELLDLFDFAGP